ncbi:hypothetical protein HHI36_023952 [Cryptolaemus montrouzieri]|uniref:Chitin-binding type-2 domain-containing protein n=1 Tax=Cryptolaemus montrouzieri TaxID=559131 RepID=A0ABD2PK93_9CUCU
MRMRNIYTISFMVILILESSNSQTTCMSAGKFLLPDDATNRTYYICTAPNSTRIYFRCPTNYIFNDSTKLCQPQSNQSTTCSLLQIILRLTPDPSGDSTSYIDCRDPSLGPVKKQCQVGSTFSPILLCCYNGSSCVAI